MEDGKGFGRPRGTIGAVADAAAELGVDGWAEALGAAPTSSAALVGAAEADGAGDDAATSASRACVATREGAASLVSFSESDQTTKPIPIPIAAANPTMAREPPRLRGAAGGTLGSLTPA